MVHPQSRLHHSNGKLSPGIVPRRHPWAPFGREVDGLQNVWFHTSNFNGWSLMELWGSKKKGWELLDLQRNFKMLEETPTYNHHKCRVIYFPHEHSMQTFPRLKRQGHWVDHIRRYRTKLKKTSYPFWRFHLLGIATTYPTFEPPATVLRFVCWAEIPPLQDEDRKEFCTTVDRWSK